MAVYVPLLNFDTFGQYVTSSEPKTEGKKGMNH